MAAAASPISLAATGLSAFGKISAGSTASANAITQANSTNQADQFRAQQLADQAETGRVAATQTDSDMRLATLGKLANIAVIRGAANTDPNSPTGYAIAARTEEVGDENRQQRVSNITAQADQSQLASGMYAQAGANALMQGYANAGNDQTTGLLGALAVGLGGASGLVGPNGLNISGNTSLPNNANGTFLGFGRF